MFCFGIPLPELDDFNDSTCDDIQEPNKQVQIRNAKINNPNESPSSSDSSVDEVLVTPVQVRKINKIPRPLASTSSRKTKFGKAIHSLLKLDGNVPKITNKVMSDILKGKFTDINAFVRRIDAVY